MVFLIIGCATAPIQQISEEQQKMSFNRPYDDVWKAAVQTLSGDMGLPISVIEKDSGIINTEMVTPSGSQGWANCPSGFLTVWQGARYRVNLIAQNEGDVTVIRLNPHFEAFESNVSNSWHVCHSTGKLEEQFFNLMKSRLNK